MKVNDFNPARAHDECDRVCVGIDGLLALQSQLDQWAN